MRWVDFKDLASLSNTLQQGQWRQFLQVLVYTALPLSRYTNGSQIHTWTAASERLLDHNISLETHGRNQIYTSILNKNTRGRRMALTGETWHNYRKPNSYGNELVKEKKSQDTSKMKWSSAPGIPTWSPTVVLTRRYDACLAQSRRDAKVSSFYGRTHGG